MWPWLICRAFHRRMHKLRDVHISTRYRQTWEEWRCRLCPRRRWRRLRKLW